MVESTETNRLLHKSNRWLLKNCKWEWGSVNIKNMEEKEKYTMLEKIFGIKQIQISKVLFILLFISMLMAPFVENVIVKIFCILVILLTFINALVMCCKVIIYWLKRDIV